MDPADYSKRVLVVDDDPDILTLVGMTLELEGFEIMKASSAKEALECIDKYGLPHLAVVDIMMPGMSGVELCRKIQSYSDLPAIMLTAVDDERTKVEAIEEVAEDYVTKPFNPEELAARVKRLLRRIGDLGYADAPVAEIDERLAIDFAHQRAIIEGDAIDLTPTEAKLLHILTRSAPRTVTTDYLLGRLWPDKEVYEETLRVHVHRLRHKLEPNPSRPCYVKTERGLGYKFQANGAA